MHHPPNSPACRRHPAPTLSYTRPVLSYRRPFRKARAWSCLPFRFAPLPVWLRFASVHISGRSFLFPVRTTPLDLQQLTVFPYKTPLPARLTQRQTCQIRRATGTRFSSSLTAGNPPAMATLTVAALQLALSSPGEAENIAAIALLVEQAAAQGAQLILPPELFSGPYFCKVEDEALFALARPTAEHPSVIAMQALAARLKVAIPTSFFERDGQHYYNTVAMIDDRGEVLGTYRKSHIPDGPGYEEKFYFRPGNSGFKVWDVCGAAVGVGICWDQWYPEAARAMALMGAELLLYPTAIGAEPYDAGLDTSRMWRRAMQGHAVSNCMPVVAANRIGVEEGQSFYGHSFIADEWGDLVAEFAGEESGVLIARLDLARAAKHRAGMGFFRDRRPELYGRIGADI